MKRALGIGLLVVGVILLVWGFQTTESFSSQVQEFFTGSPSDKAIWMIVGGALCAVAGLVLVLVPGGTKRAL